MNEQLHERVLMVSAAGVVISYFLPWITIMSSFGNTQIKGQFLDYSWAYLLLSILCLVLMFVLKNAEGLGIPPAYVPRLKLAGTVSPLLILAFVTWAGATFEFRRLAVGDRSVWGVDLSSDVRVGLDYGFWLAIVATVTLVCMTVLGSSKKRLFASTAVVVIATVALVALAVNWPGKTFTPSKANPAVSTPADNPQASPAAEPTLDASPYVSDISVNGRILPKDLEAERFSNSIEIYLRYKNISDKAIVGLHGKIDVLDGFGNSRFSFNFRDDHKTEPNSESNRGAYSFEGNQFENDDPYAKMYPLIEGGTVKYRVTVDSIAFADGTQLTAK